MTDEPIRPDPDALLAAAQAAEARAARGRLKIYVGSSAGVGKTWSMLDAAQRLREQQIDVVVGIVETHGRSETAQQLQGLERLPRRALTVQGRTLEEFDLDGALARRPASWSTNWRTATRPAHVTRSAGRTSTNCSTPASTCGPR